MEGSASYRIGMCGALAVLLLLLLELSLRFLTKKPSLAQNQKAERSSADALLHAGDVLATLLIAASTVEGTVHGLSVRDDVVRALGFGVAAEVLFLVGSRAQHRLFAASKLTGEIERGNEAAGVAAAGHSLATGILAAGAVAGESVRDLGLSFVFFALATAALLGLVSLFRALTVYDDAEEILGQNVAAGISYAGVTVAVAVLVGRASEGEFTGWKDSLTGFAQMLAYAPLLYCVRQFVVGSVILGHRPVLRGGPLDQAIGRERNAGLAAVEAATYLGTALLVHVVDRT